MMSVHMQMETMNILNKADILIRNTRLRHRAELVDIAITDGRITAICPRLEMPADEVIHAGGSLVTPSFVNAHLHLCKVWTLPMAGEAALAAYHGNGMGEALRAIDVASHVKEKYDAAWITQNARRAVALAALHGNLHIRGFADVGIKGRLEAVKALIAVRDEFRGIVDIHVVAFPQDGIIREPGTNHLMREAMELGADIVGGIPWIEANEADAQAHIDDVGDPRQRTLEAMARTAIARGWEGRALAHHCRAMALYPDQDIPALIGLLRRAQVSVVSDPHTGPLHA
jgi:cytosine deaminase